MNDPTAEAEFRFYEELNDFLEPLRRRKAFRYQFRGSPAVKDAIEAMGVPHTEVDLVVVNGVSVGFDYGLGAGDRVAVYPRFESLDVSPIVRLRPEPLRQTRFLADFHLGKLARLLRMLGFDTAYRRAEPDATVLDQCLGERRILLTRDRQLLKHRQITHGYWIRSEWPAVQLEEVVKRFDLYSQIRPFARCTACNGLVTTVDKKEVEEHLPQRTRRFYDEFWRCRECGKIYWKGSHYERMKRRVDELRARGGR